jgi:NAD dependent epimerase/dehydratase
VTEASLSGRNVAVTGAGGFIGSHLVEALAGAGAEVRALVRYNARSDRGALEWADRSLLDGVEVVFSDVRSAEAMAEAIAGCELVFHLAAQIAIPYSFTDPRTFIETNVLGTLNVAKASLDAGVQRLLHTSTCEVYGNAQSVPMTEQHPLSPRSPYAASKIGADQTVLSMSRAMGLRATIVRPFNAYGPRQSARSVIPTIISQELSQGVVSLGATQPSRDFTYVTDLTRGFIELALSEDSVGEVVNLCSGRELSVDELVAEIGGAMDRKLVVETDEGRMRPREAEVMRMVGSADRARELIGWEPRVPLAQGLAETAAWIERNLDNYRPEERVI